MNINYKGTEYPLATTLRVAYKIQGQFNHKSYIEIFENFGTMKLEEQINILYTSVCVATPEFSFSTKKDEFLNYFLDNYDLSYLMDAITFVVSGIMGKELLEKSKGDSSTKEEVDDVFTVGTSSSKEELSAE